MALDWFTGLVGYDASALRLPHLVSLTIDGSVEWDIERWQEAEGSWSSKLQVSRALATPSMRRAAERLGLACSPEALRISGNPTKFLQGHNVFGPSVSDLATVVRETVRRLPGVLRPADCDRAEWPAVGRSRVDTQTHVDLGSDRAVHEWLMAAERFTRSRHGRAMLAGTTVYWGQHSRRWTIKAYCKFCELATHPPAEHLDELRAYSEGHLRLELTLRTLELKPRGTLTDDVLWEYFDRVVNAMPKTGDGKLEVEMMTKSGLPLAVQSQVLLWLSGREVRRMMPRRTFYKYRRQVLDALGVDLSLPCYEQQPQVERVGFTVDYLKAREVHQVPVALQPLLFKVGGSSPRWAVR